MYVTCFYRNGVCVQEREFKSRDLAELAGLDGLKFGAEVSIYTPRGNVLKGWNKRMS